MEKEKRKVPVTQVVALLLALGIGLKSFYSDVNQAKSANGRYRSAAVVADSRLCSQIGTQVMTRHHGNVVDATVATLICNGVVNAHSAGIGGGAVFVFYNRTTGQAIAVNARERAPAEAASDMFISDTTLAQIGGKAIGVPGELKGLWVLHQRYGKVPWSTLIQPTIDLCINGVPLTEAQRNASKSRRVEFKKNKNTEFRYLYDEKFELFPVDYKIPRPKLAETLKVIAREGADAFYNGPLTEGIVADIRDNGGIITKEDLQSFYAEESAPVTLTSGQRILFSMPLPSSGLVLEYILNILSGYKFGPESVSTVDKSVLTYHRIVEAMKFAYARRSEFGDPSFLNIFKLYGNMTSPEVGEEIRRKIYDSRTHDTCYYGAKFEAKDKLGTAHFSLMDSNGDAVSVTSSINVYYGSRVKGSRTGIIFNCAMDDFCTPNSTNHYCIPSSPANFIAPGKRPVSSMAPTVVVDKGTGAVQLVVGAAGGTRITTTLALVMLKVLWLNQTLTSAVDDPRLHHQLAPNQIDLEDDFPEDIRQGLKDKGHMLSTTNKTVVTAIHRTSDNMLEAVSDYRKGGAPDGF